MKPTIREGEPESVLRVTVEVVNPRGERLGQPAVFRQWFIHAYGGFAGTDLGRALNTFLRQFVDAATEQT